MLLELGGRKKLTCTQRDRAISKGWWFKLDQKLRGPGRGGVSKMCLANDECREDGIRLGLVCRREGYVELLLFGRFLRSSSERDVSERIFLENTETR